MSYRFINTFIEPKENMSKKVKEHIRTVSHQVHNTNKENLFKINK